MKMGAERSKGEKPVRLLPFAFCSLGDGISSVRAENYFLVGAITSLAALATRNLTTVLALILMAAPV